MKASLVEPGMLYFTKNILNKCKENRFLYNSILLNLIASIIFISCIFLLLWYLKNNKDYKQINALEIDNIKKEYAIETIRKIKEFQEKHRNEMVSTLPYENNIYK